MKLSTFTIIKNESEYVRYNIMSILDYIDEMVFFDGNSTDGTIEIIKEIKEIHDKQNKIKLFENKDCKNLKEDYVRLFNECLSQCSGDYVWFLHPDMICINPEQIKLVEWGKLRYSVNMESMAEGNKKIVCGRSNKWNTIYKNDFGIHYHGFYGSPEEDLYFREITGNEHKLYSQYKDKPYIIGDSKINLIHYCDCKPYSRRLERMKSVLSINSPSIDWTKESENHPRVTLKDGFFNNVYFKFEDCNNDYLNNISLKEKSIV